MHMTISRRLISTLAIALLALLFVEAVGLWRLNQAQQRFEYVQEKIIPGTKVLTDINEEIGNIRRLIFRDLLITDSAGRTGVEQAIASADKHVQDLVDDYERNDMAGDDDRQLLEAERAALAAYLPGPTPYIEKCPAN